MPVSIQIHRRAELNQELQRVERVLNNPTPVWEPVVRKVLIPSIRETFLSEGDGRWARRLDNLPHPLLRKSGTLYDSLIRPGARGNVNIQSPNSLEYGTDIPYADYHEFGTSRIPARPYLLYAVENIEGKVAREMDQWFQSEFNRGRR